MAAARWAELCSFGQIGQGQGSGAACQQGHARQQAGVDNVDIKFVRRSNIVPFLPWCVRAGCADGAAQVLLPAGCGVAISGPPGIAAAVARREKL